MTDHLLLQLTWKREKKNKDCTYVLGSFCWARCW
uniref:Uncharacterized protein n=1 Tax=Arundo donax TaxID=35708 RepID=A0A0A9FKT6_ARUDO